MTTSHHQLTWRVRGFPLISTPESVVQIVREKCGLDDASGNSVETSVLIRTLAPDSQRRTQQATIYFDPVVPPKLIRDLEQQGGREVTYKIPGNDGKRLVRLSFDTHFKGQTVLHDPDTAGCAHGLNILAISGLGSHAYGSFVGKDDKNMWLAENVPENFPGARVILWGYDTKLGDNVDFSHIEDLAHDPYLIIKQLLLSGRPLLLIGHSLGGLLIQEAMSKLVEDHHESGDTESEDIFMSNIGIVFFGVPSQGMDISSLRAMVQGQPNRALLETLEVSNSPVLRNLLRRFHTALSISRAELYCFYETFQSPAIVQDPISQEFSRNGHPQCLVNRASATASLLPGTSPAGHALPLRRNHSDLVKFSYHDPEYADKVDYILGLLHKKLCSRQNTFELKDPAGESQRSPNLAEEAKGSEPAPGSLSNSQFLKQLEDLGLSSSPSGEVQKTGNPDYPSRTKLQAPRNDESAGYAAQAARSPSSSEHVRLLFVNEWGKVATVQWLDGQGEWRTYFDVVPGTTQVQDTFVGHVWRALDLDTGIVISRYTASKSENRCVIEAPRPSTLSPDEQIYGKQWDNHSGHEVRTKHQGSYPTLSHVYGSGGDGSICLTKDGEEVRSTKGLYSWFRNI